MGDAYMSNVNQFFTDRVQYVVPPYQRNYVWDKERWQSLWDDLIDVAEGRSRKHFVGILVLQNLMVRPGGGLPGRYSVVDGQQRLTTIQLLNSALRDTARARGLKPLVERAIELAFNADTQADFEPKFVPCLADKPAFLRVMGSLADPVAQATDPTFAPACSFFVDQIQKHLKAAKDPVDALRVVHHALTTNFTFTVIILDDLDDPQSVYERLNSGGEPLHAAHLVRNHVLQMCERYGPPEAYRDYWERFDKDSTWNARVTYTSETYMDVLLRTFLIVEARATGDLAKVFAEFRDHVTDKVDDLADVLRRLLVLAEVFRRLRTGTGLSESERRFTECLQLTNSYAFLPVAIALADRFPPEQCGPALDVMRSYLLRRIICGQPTNGYPGMVRGMIMAAMGDRTPARGLAAYLSGRSGNTAWPTDDQVRMAIGTWPAYPSSHRDSHRRRKTELVTHLLLLLETHLAGTLTEPIRSGPGVLSVEHLMPQAWDKTWPPVTELEAKQRATAIHTLGNLTIVTPKLNEELSNDTWPNKRRHLRANSLLRLNMRLPDDFPDAAAIARRGRELADLLVVILPGPANGSVPALVIPEPDDWPDPAAEGEDLELADEPTAANFPIAETEPETEGDLPAPGTTATQPVTGPSISARVRKALRDVGGGPLTYLEIARTDEELKASVVKWLLRGYRISGVRTTTKDGQVAGELWSKRSSKPKSS
jgi:uncharacterized protein DUF262/uncharacterized protein DUF1524